MKEVILNNINNALELEKLYRSAPETFAANFNDLLPQIEGSPAVEFWSARLNFSAVTLQVEGKELSQPPRSSAFRLGYTIAACLMAGFIVKIPQIFGVSPEIFYLNNLSFIVIPLFMVYYFYKNQSPFKIVAVFLLILIVSVIYINLLPGDSTSNTHVLASIHIVLFTWLMWGITFVNNNLSSDELKLKFIKRNGDIVVLSAVILCAGMLLTALTLGLFSLIKIEIHKFYFDYVVMIGCASAPLVANYMIENSPKLINRVAPFIAKVFTPLVLISITCFLIALIFFSNDPFSSREELMTYNLLLIAILAIIVFSFSGQDYDRNSIYNKILLVLSLEAIIVNCIALSAIIYRIIAFGITPNRLAVFGANVLMFINLIFISLQLWKYISNKSEFRHLIRAMVIMFPYYLAWTILITFIFPFVFLFR